MFSLSGELQDVLLEGFDLCFLTVVGLFSVRISGQHFLSLHERITQNMFLTLFLTYLDRTWGFHTFPADYIHSRWHIIFILQADIVKSFREVIKNNGFQNPKNICFKSVRRDFGLQTFEASSREEISRIIRSWCRIFLFFCLRRRKFRKNEKYSTH